VTEPQPEPIVFDPFAQQPDAVTLEVDLREGTAPAGANVVKAKILRKPARQKPATGPKVDTK
jgi:hypothetical protein